MRRVVAAVAVLVGLLAVQAVTAATASAHAVLESATPANGAMLASPPELVELVFSETVGQPAALAVLGPDGEEVAGGDLQVVDRTLSRTYDPTSFAAGTYTVSYEVTSADGHPVTGSLSFMLHGDAEDAAEMADAGGSLGGGDATDADPTTVALLALGLVIALGVSLWAMRRLISQPDGAGTE